MKRTILFFAFMSYMLLGYSQKVYFIYIQSETGKPFTVQMNEQKFTSAPSGYLILSKLRDSTYSFSVSFLEQKSSGHNFTIVVSKKDHGYLLKNFGDKGWGLFDMQTMEIQMTQGELKKEAASKTESKEASDFTNILSKAADDPSLKETPAPPKVQEPQTVTEEKKIEKTVVVTGDQSTGKSAEDTKVKEKPVAPAIVEPKTPVEEKPANKTPVSEQKTGNSNNEEGKSDLPLAPSKEKTITDEKVNKTEAKPAGEKAKEENVIQQPVVEEKANEYKTSVVTRKSESSTTEGFGLTFTDLYSDGMTDTIRILIPNSKPVVSPVATEKQEQKEEKKFLETDITATAGVKTPQPQDNYPEAVKKASSNNCSSVADENDFLRTRKKMASETSDDNMIAEAKKIFKTKCFSTAHIKNLSLLFLNDKGKYDFFDAAYGNISDLGNFPSLESELKDLYYINRFKAMLR